MAANAASRCLHPNVLRCLGGGVGLEGCPAHFRPISLRRKKARHPRGGLGHVAFSRIRKPPPAVELGGLSSSSSRCTARDVCRPSQGTGGDRAKRTGGEDLDLSSATLQHAHKIGPQAVRLNGPLQEIYTTTINLCSHSHSFSC